MLALNAEQTRLYVQLRLKKTELIGGKATFFL